MKNQAGWGEYFTRGIFREEVENCLFTLTGSNEVQEGSKGDETRIVAVSQKVWLDDQGVGADRRVSVEWE